MATRTAPRRSELTGAQLAHILNVLGVKLKDFAYHCGVAERSAVRWVSGEFDGQIPVVAEWVLLAYRLAPRTRFLQGKLALPNLPIDEWMAAPAAARPEGTPGRPLAEREGRKSCGVPAQGVV
jgi:hypothetical protein